MLLKILNIDFKLFEERNFLNTLKCKFASTFMRINNDTSIVEMGNKNLSVVRVIN